MGFYKLELNDKHIIVSTTKEDKGLSWDKTFSILKKELELRNVSFNTEMLQYWFDNNSKEFFSIPYSNIDTTTKFEIEKADDLLSAYMTIFPALEDEHKLTLGEIKSQLLAKGITYGIDEVKIMIALAEKNYVIELLIAQGRNPVHGQDGEIKYHFYEKGVEIKPKELENGNVDFYNINLIQVVKEGQLLVEKIPATKGNPGITVTGKEIPAFNGKDVIIPIGKNLVLSTDKTKGYAACEGHVVIVERRVSVLPVFEVNGDVDFSSGNIDFVGNVVVRGNIRDGFTVKAKGDVEIFGTVEGGNVYSSGNIFIKKGIRGLKKSMVDAQGSIYSNFIEYANISAGIDVIVNEAIMHSTVNSGLTIQVGGRKGLVVGGTSRAGKALICKNIGSNLATLTNIEVGIKPETRMIFKETTQQILQVKDNLDKTSKAVKLLMELKGKLINLPPDKEALLSKLKETKMQLEKQHEDLQLLKFELEKQIKELEEGYIKVSGMINCGVNVTIGRANKHFTNEMYKVTLRQKGADISISPLEANNEEVG
ncbi:MAG: DUF342 domain-containing protein [Bacillota bacterium]